jgi:transcriptional regulator with XRE-family HTH domain
MNIKSVISKRGYSVNSLSKKMGVWQSALNTVTNGTNPTIGKLKEVADALECSWLEFFADEVTIDDLRSAFPDMIAQIEKPAAVVNLKAPAVEASPADELPFNNQQEQKPTVQTQAAVLSPLICPHCGSAFVVEVKKA